MFQCSVILVDSLEELDALNTVMINHLTNDMYIYEHVCLNVRDIQELKLIRLPSTFQESRAKLRAIDPCLVDIRLSPFDEQERKSDQSPPLPPIARRPRGESLGSNGGGALISSSSNESSSSFGYQSNDKFMDESFEEGINKFSRLATNTLPTARPGTLLAKKVLPKKIDRNHTRSNYPPNQLNRSTSPKKSSSVDNRRKTSPIRVTITSKLNPDAMPFFAPQRPTPPSQNPSITFYERNHFQPPPLQPVISANHVQPVKIPTHQQRPQQNSHRSHQRFIPPRQMAIKKSFNAQPSSLTDLRSFPQPQNRPNTSSQEQIPSNEFSSSHSRHYERFCFTGLMVQTSSNAINQILSTPPIRERLSVPGNRRPRQSPANLRPTGSLPFQNRHSGDFNHFQMPGPFGEKLASARGQRTISGTSSGSSLSVDIGPHSIIQMDSRSRALTSPDGQYDFEKANEEFRRYLELEELVTRRAPSACSNVSYPDENSNASQAHSYKKEISFFDRISCTATTGTAVAYTEMDEKEKNLETFGDDALLVGGDSEDLEWVL